MMVIQGYPVCWNDTAVVGDHRERFLPGAFQSTHTRLAFQHDHRPGAALAWHVPLVQDQHGLRFCAEVDESRRDVRQIIAAIRHGGVNYCSVWYTPIETSWDGDTEVIARARLMEISIASSAAAYQRSGCWIGGDDLSRAPQRLGALAEAYGYVPTLVARRPPEIMRIAPCRRPSAQGPVQAAVQSYMGRYLARMPAWTAC